MTYYLSIGEFPWTVGIMYKNEGTILGTIIANDTYFFRGSGSLISTKAVLTAATVVFEMDPSNLRIYAGLWDHSMPEFLLDIQKRDANIIHIHENYAENIYGPFNIAIIELKEAFSLVDHINVICLPQADQPKLNITTTCYGSGWGIDEYNSPTNIKPKPLSQIIKRVDLSIRNADYVTEQAKKEGIQSSYHLFKNSSFIWAGGDNGAKSSALCKYDEGAPLACPQAEDDTYYLAGIYVGTYWNRCDGKIPGNNAKFILLLFSFFFANKNKMFRF